MEEQAVRRHHREEHEHRDRRLAAPRPCRGDPQRDGAGEEQAQAELEADCSPDGVRAVDDDPRDRRAGEHELREQRLVPEQLPPLDHVVLDVAPEAQADGERLDAVEEQGAEEDGAGAPDPVQRRQADAERMLRRECPVVGQGLGRGQRRPHRHSVAAGDAGSIGRTCGPELDGRLASVDRRTPIYDRLKAPRRRAAVA